MFQAINTPLILFRFINDLALPCTSIVQTFDDLLSKIIDFLKVNTYHAVNKISKLLRLSFTFQSSPIRIRKDSFPEAKLMSLLLIAVKVSQCFDPSHCRPRTDTEPAALVIDWNVWGPAFQESNKDRQSHRRGEEMKVAEEDVFRMNSEQLDQYLDWYENTWAEEGDTICKYPFHAMKCHNKLIFCSTRGLT